MKILERASLARSTDLTLGTLSERLAALHGDRRLVEEAGEPPFVLTHRQAADLVARWAGGLVARIEPGERVVVAMPNGYRFLLACLAVSRAGGLPVPVNPRMADDETDHVVADSGARLVLRTEADLSSTATPLAHAVPASATDVGALFYTSGTTGRPKGARLTHRALLGPIATAALFPSGLRQDEAVLALPVAHIMGFAALLGLAGAGVPTFLLPSFDAAAVLDAIEGRQATAFIGVPAMYRLLLEAGAERRDLSSVRLWASGADVMPPELARRFQKMGATLRLPFVGDVGEAAFVEGYGLVELGGGAIARVAPPGFRLPFGDALGIPLPGNRVKIVDDAGQEVRPGVVGELLVKSAGVLEGYHDDDEATAATITSDGWLRTGDLARKGPFGSIAFSGRKKDVVKVGGYSVFAVEVERVLEEHPDVVEAAVVGLPDERMGEVPAAAVRLRAGATTSAEQLVTWAATRLAGYKAPRRIIVVDDLPRTGTTKVQKARLLPLFS